MAGWGELNIARARNTIDARKATSDASLQGNKQLSDILQYLNEEQTAKEMQNQKLQHEAGMENMQFGEGGYGAGADQYNKSQPPGFLEGILKSLNIGKDVDMSGARQSALINPEEAPAPTLGEQLPNLTKGTRTQSTMDVAEQGAMIDAQAQARSLAEFRKANPDSTMSDMEYLKGYAPGNYVDRTKDKGDDGLSSWIKGQLGNDPQFKQDYMTSDPVTGEAEVDMDKVRKDKDNFLTRSTKIIQEASVYDKKDVPFEVLSGQLKRWSEGQVAPAASSGVAGVPKKDNTINITRAQLLTNLDKELAVVDTKGYPTWGGKEKHDEAKKMMTNIRNAVGALPEQEQGFNILQAETLMNRVLANPSDPEIGKKFKEIFGYDMFSTQKSSGLPPYLKGGK